MNLCEVDEIITTEVVIAVIYRVVGGKGVIVVGILFFYIRAIGQVGAGRVMFNVTVVVVVLVVLGIVMAIGLTGLLVFKVVVDVLVVSQILLILDVEGVKRLFKGIGLHGVVHRYPDVLVL